ncbi:transcriptional regulator FtsR [Modestobacter roseus]|uniref:MerR-like DNA binding protein n=1 Tax=Modestobacter roseus TaxID=1181884 RepID=A0A562IP26_9ACTN|nr:MerR family transcriptional regulator [Modestobacter roseus]MQA35384.1 MerR family DNA-binding transcriptional regulator [Modestobacter roseus]TWH72779.1 MerR-like DNA binding protein [Modestobacter roseus]
MSAVPRRDTGGNGALLTIGEVLAALRGDFPDVTISKIRYLESEQLVHPQRTPSGYRKFSAADVARLRYVLAAQRDQYLPLRVIKEHLEALDRGEPLPGQAESGAGPATDEALAAAGPMPAAEFAEAAGVDERQLADFVQFGLVGTDRRGRLQAVDLPVARAAAALARHGLEARHLRAWRTGADREAALLEQLVAPVLRARSDEARGRATEQVQELAGLSAQLHTALLEARLREVLGG